jgi:hypothetical protein
MTLAILPPPRVVFGTVLASIAAVAACSSASNGDPMSSPADAEAGIAADAANAPETSATDAAPREAGDSGEAPVVGSAACNAYCNLLMSTCVGTFVQFATNDACMRACAIYPPGASDDNTGLGNTLRCRMQHAEAAKVEYLGHCPHAGAFGFNACGSTCENICQLAQSWCGAGPGGNPFGSTASCEAACDSMQYAPARPDGLVAFNAEGPTSGDTLDCRMYQLVKSLESSAARSVYCPRIAFMSAVCR